jgi:hypothetical protein
MPILRHRQLVVDRDALDHEDVVLGLDLSDRLNLEPFALDLDLTRLQRAGESARQSAAGGGHDIVEGRRMWRELVRRNPVVLSDLRMDPEHHWVLLSRKIRQALGTAEPLDAYAGDIAGLGHEADATPSCASAVAGCSFRTIAAACRCGSRCATTWELDH